MNLLTALMYLRISKPSIQTRDFDLLLKWLDPPLRYGHNYRITYELSRALHDYCFDGTGLGTYKYEIAVRSPYLNHLTSEEQKELTSWIYASNISRTQEL